MAEIVHMSVRTHLSSTILFFNIRELLHVLPNTTQVVRTYGLNFWLIAKVSIQSPCKAWKHPVKLTTKKSLVYII